MAWCNKGPELEVRASFEAVRTAPQCLAEAYERLVPIPRRPTRVLALAKVPSRVPAAPNRSGWRRAERG